MNNEDQYQEQIEQPIGRLLIELSRHYMDYGLDQVGLAGFSNITRADILLLISIPENGTIAKIVAERLKVSKQAVSQKLDSLQKRGYLTRTSVKQDGRSYHIFLTEQGLRLRNAALEGTGEIENNYRSIVGEHEFSTIKSQLGKICNSLGIVDQTGLFN